MRETKLKKKKKKFFFCSPTFLFEKKNMEEFRKKIKIMLAKRFH